MRGFCLEVISQLRPRNANDLISLDELDCVLRILHTVEAAFERRITRSTKHRESSSSMTGTSRDIVYMRPLSAVCVRVYP
jgi:hypothetical protein